MGNCPNRCGSTPRAEWCRSDDGRLHLGARCPSCRLWLRWLPHDTPDAPVAVTVEPFRRAT